MPQNIEIKARINNPGQVHKRATLIADQPAKIIQQEDIFFHCDNGRLKLRILAPNLGELIFYKRKNQSGPKTSTYCISKTDNPNQLREVLTVAYGENITVRKIRHLYLVGRTRIHIDEVEGLGDFLELEVVLDKGDDLISGEHEARTLMRQLDINPSDLIDVAYADLLAMKTL